MDRPCAGGVSCGDNPFAIEIALRGGRRADQKCLVGIGNVRRGAISLAIHCDCAQP